MVSEEQLKEHTASRQITLIRPETTQSDRSHPNRPSKPRPILQPLLNANGIFLFGREGSAGSFGYQRS